MDIKHIIQIIVTVILVCAMALAFITVIKKNDKKTYIFEGMILGFAIGIFFGVYYFNPLISAFIGMFLGIGIGKSKKRQK